jgi:MATE family multidrug resistance protein
MVVAAPAEGFYHSEAKATLRLGWKLAVMNGMKMSVEVVSYMYVGRLGEIYLSSAGLANVTNNVTGNSILTGLAGALSTLAGQAHGAKDLGLLNELLQRSVLILLSVCVPLSISWLASAHIMIALGQDPEIARLAASYLSCLVPALFCKAYSLCLEGWLTAQQRTDPPAVIGAVAAVLHPLWCYLFIFVFDMHYLGSAIAISATRSLEALLFTIYIIHFNIKENNSFQFTMEATRNWGSYLRLGLPNILMNSQWW